jgi:hypothetical protein
VKAATHGTEYADHGIWWTPGEQENPPRVTPVPVCTAPIGPVAALPVPTDAPPPPAAACDPPGPAATVPDPETAAPPFAPLSDVVPFVPVMPDALEVWPVPEPPIVGKTRSAMRPRTPQM